MTFAVLFPAYRRMRGEFTRTVAAKIALEDEVRSLRREKDELTNRVAAADEAARKAWETVANWLAKRAGLGTISLPDDAIPDPPRAEGEPIPASHALARELVEQGERQFQDELAAAIREQ